MRQLSMIEARKVVGGWDSTENPTNPQNGVPGAVDFGPKGGLVGRISDAIGKVVDGIVAIVDRIADVVVEDDSARSGTTSCAPGQDLHQTPDGPECVTPRSGR